MDLKPNVTEEIGSDSSRQNRIRALTRAVLGATAGFLPYALFFLMRDVRLDVGTASILWLLTTWVIFSEWWSVDDNLSAREITSLTIIFLTGIYLVALVLLPMALMIGLSERRELYHLVIALGGLSLLDVPISLIYRSEATEEGDKALYFGYFIFDLALAILYLLILVLFVYVLFEVSLLPKALILFGVYGLEFLCDWKVVPRLTRTPRPGK